MKIILFLMATGLVSCGAEKNESNQTPDLPIAKAHQITNQADVPAAVTLPGALIARVKVDASGNPIGQPETRQLEGSLERFGSDEAAVAKAFQASAKADYETLDGDSSTSQHYYRGTNRSLYYYHSHNHYPHTYYRYYFPRYDRYSNYHGYNYGQGYGYRDFYYVNYSYHKSYFFNSYRYNCYTPSWW